MGNGGEVFEDVAVWRGDRTVLAPKDRVDPDHPALQDIAPDIRRAAIIQEASEFANRQMGERLAERRRTERGLGPVSQGLGPEYPKRTGRRIARQADSGAELRSLLRKEFGSHGITTVSDAEALVRTALETYAQRRDDVDAFWIRETETDLVSEFRETEEEQELQPRVERVREIATEIKTDITRQLIEQQNEFERRERIRKLAEKTGLRPSFVADFLAVYDQYRDPFKDHPGKIDTRKYTGQLIRVPKFFEAFLWLDTPEGKDFLLDITPFVGEVKALIEAGTGEKLISGQKLKGWERFVNVAVTAAPVAAQALSRRALRGGRAARVWATAAKGVSPTASAVSFAIVAAKRGIAIETMLLFVAGLSKLPPKQTRGLLTRISRASRSTDVKLTRAEVKTLSRVANAYRPLAKTQRRSRRAVPSGRRTVRPRPRRPSQAARRKMREAGAQVERYFKKHPLLSHDDETIAAVGQLFRKTRGGPRRYSKSHREPVPRRAAAGEMKMIRKFHSQIHPTHEVARIRLLKPTNKKGDRTPDFELTFSDGSTLFVETRTITKKRYGPRDVYRAFRDKIKHGQINLDRPGIVSVIVQHPPRSGRYLLRQKDLDDLEQLMKAEFRDISDPIEELQLVYPSGRRSTIARVGSKTSDYSIVDERLTVPPPTK